MIAGLIESNLGNSRYTVRISYDVAKATAEVEALDAALSGLGDGKVVAQQRIDTLGTEMAGLKAQNETLKEQIAAEQAKPEYPGDGYDFRDQQEMARLENLRADLLSQYNAKLAAAASYYSLMQDEKAKPVDEAGNPECIEEFYCEARFELFESGRAQALDDAEALAGEYNQAGKDLEAEMRKLPHPDDVGAGFYQDGTQLKEWKKTLADNEKQIADDQEEIQRTEFYMAMLKAEILEKQKKREFINNHKGGDKVLTAYSNEYDDTLTGIVAVELIGGNYQYPVIVPADTVDGRIATALNISREHCFSNLAMISGWLKWQQRHAVAEVQSVDGVVVASIYPIGHPMSMVGPVYPFDHTQISAATTYPYEVGDQALVAYTPFGEMAFKGWYKEPRVLIEEVFIFIYDLLGTVESLWMAYSVKDGGLIMASDDDYDVYLENKSYYDSLPVEQVPESMYFKRYERVATSGLATQQVGDYFVESVTVDNDLGTATFSGILNGNPFTKTVEHFILPAYKAKDDPACVFPPLNEECVYVEMCNPAKSNPLFYSPSSYRFKTYQPTFRKWGGQAFILERGCALYTEWSKADGALCGGEISTWLSYLIFDENLNLIGQPFTDAPCPFVSVGGQAVWKKK